MCRAGVKKNKEYGLEIISICPGLVDTSMQLAARSKTIDEYKMADFCMQAYLESKLQKPEIVAEKIYTILENKYEQGQFINVSEV
jgi:benzil reductase ((S)-benzoin forming)